MRDGSAKHLAQGTDATPFQLFQQFAELAGDRYRLGDGDGQGVLDLAGVEVVRMPVERQPVVGVRGVLEDIGEEIVVVPAAHPARQFPVAADPTQSSGGLDSDSHSCVPQMCH